MNRQSGKKTFGIQFSKTFDVLVIEFGYWQVSNDVNQLLVSHSFQVLRNSVVERWTGCAIGSSTSD